MERLKTIWRGIPGVAKAFMAGATAAVGWFVSAGLADPNLPLLEALLDGFRNVGGMTAGQWVSLLGVIGAAYGFTWWIPNRPTA